MTTAIEPDQLPGVITTYLRAHAPQRRDTDAALLCFAADAVVTDDAHTYHGRDEIRGWLDRSAAEYTYTSTLTGATRLDDGRFDAVHHLAGDFPGGVVDLHYRFTVRDNHITALVIEP